MFPWVNKSQAKREWSLYVKMTVCLKQFHLVTFFFPRLCALYCKYIVHGILEFLAISFHCLQKYQLDFIGFFFFYFSVTFEFYSILLSEWVVFVFTVCFLIPCWWWWCCCCYCCCYLAWIWGESGSFTFCAICLLLSNTYSSNRGLTT